jgi:hypothetical protein
MRTKLDPDDESFISEREIDWSVARPSRFIRRPAERSEIVVDGAVGYSLRLIPSNKILARFETTLDAWPAIIAAVEGGRSPRTLSLDWNAADGSSGSISAGPRLERFARVNNGELNSYPSAGPRAARKRVAEGAA